MPENGIRSTYSQCPFQIDMYDNHGMFSSGTAFFYSTESDTYLITNWHNVSGKHPFENTYLASGHRSPLLLKARLATWVDDTTAPRLFSLVPYEIALYRDGNSSPTWFEHPSLGRHCDVVAIPFKRPSLVPDFMHNSANKIGDLRVPILPGSVAFIIGFPQALSVGFGLPIWKSGYIASEPHYDVSIRSKMVVEGGVIDGIRIPAIFLDALTRPGMSGSPVFAQFSGMWQTSDPYKQVDPAMPDFWSRDDIALNHTAKEFVGIYSGRLPEAENSAARGMCIKESAIKEICEAKKIGSHPHIT